MEDLEPILKKVFGGENGMNWSTLIEQRYETVQTGDKLTDN